jgi:hypothetical protein
MLSADGCPEVGFEEIAIDLLQARFWMASALPIIHELDWLPIKRARVTFAFARTWIS